MKVIAHRIGMGIFPVYMLEPVRNILIEVKTTGASFRQLSFPADKIKRKDKEPQIWKGDREGFENTHGKCLCKNYIQGMH